MLVNANTAVHCLFM